MLNFNEFTPVNAMLEWIDARPAINVQEEEYQRLLGYPPNYMLNGRAQELASRARQWYAENGKPWIYARQAELSGTENKLLRIDGAAFTSQPLHEQLIAAHAHQVLLVAVSAGKACEEKARQLWQEQKPDEYFFLEMYGSAVVEHLITIARGRLCAWADQRGSAVLPHYSPGYPGWRISDQDSLLKLIRQGKGYDFPEEIQVLDTGMLRPKKSLLAVFGISRHLDRVQTRREWIPCKNCSLPSCQYRRAPYQHSLRQIEDVRQLQPSKGKNSPPPNFPFAALNQNAKYTFNTRALRKWSQERLQLKMLDDGFMEARFRYEGTTCSNLGRPLEFEYHIKLGSADGGYKIIAADCRPAPGDTGHTFMCQYLKDAGTLMEAIKNEKPFLGRPLNEILTRERQYSPSGCYCTSGSRQHKWRLVLEVIHYALVQSEIIF